MSVIALIIGVVIMWAINHYDWRKTSERTTSYD